MREQYSVLWSAGGRISISPLFSAFNLKMSSSSLDLSVSAHLSLRDAPNLFGIGVESSLAYPRMNVSKISLDLYRLYRLATGRLGAFEQCLKRFRRLQSIPLLKVVVLGKKVAELRKDVKCDGIQHGLRLRAGFELGRVIFGKSDLFSPCLKSSAC